MKHDDLSERLQQHANWLYGIGSPPSPMTAADFLAAGARIDRLQAELDAKSNAESDALTVAYAQGVVHEQRRAEAQRGGSFTGWWEHQRNDNANEKHYALKGWCAGVLACERKPLDFNAMHKVTSEAHIAFCLGKFDSFEVALIRHTEKAHGVEEKT